MTDRYGLIARKQEIRRQIEQIRRSLEREQAQPTPQQRRIRQWETQLEQLMAEEYNLRRRIDQSKAE